MLILIGALWHQIPSLRVLRANIIGIHRGRVAMETGGVNFLQRGLNVLLSADESRLISTPQ